MISVRCFREDILSIDVLKDASAGAIYGGTRAASGVILLQRRTNQHQWKGKLKLQY